MWLCFLGLRVRGRDHEEKLEKRGEERGQLHGVGGSGEHDHEGQPIGIGANQAEPDKLYVRLLTGK